MLHHVIAQIITDPIVLPVGRRQQPLHPVRISLASLLGQRPAVLALQRREQPTQIRRHPLAWLRPREARRDPRVHLSQARRPARYLRHPNMISHRAQDPQPTVNFKATRRPRSKSVRL